MRFFVPVAVVLFVHGLVTAAHAQTAPPQPGGSLRGYVVDVNGAPRPGTVVQLVGGDTTIRSVGAGPNGEYRFVGLVPGQYTVRVLPERQWPSAAATGIEIRQGELVRSLVMRPQQQSRMTLLISALALYLLTLLFFRYFKIVRPAREGLQAQARAVRLRLRLEGDPARQAELQALEEVLDGLHQRIESRPMTEVLFWSQGREIATWQSLHEIERQFVAFMIPPERVLECLHSAAADLKTIDSPAAKAMAVRVAAMLESVRAAGTTAGAAPVPLEQIKPLLAESLSMIYNQRDTSFAGLMEWNNKAMWLVSVSLLAIAILGAVFDRSELLLVGATGGLMSRMARSLLRADVPTDYGASWTTLFLSPLLGAIGAWGGILLIIALHQLGILGNAFAAVSWNAESVYSPLVMALALALGFSERLFMTLVSGVERGVGSEVRRGAGPAEAPAVASDAADDGGQAGIVAGAKPALGPAARDPIVEQLDAEPGERVAFIGDPASATRQRLEAALPGVEFLSATVGELSTLAPLDAVIVEALPDAAGLDALAAAICAALSPDARVVAVGQTPAVSFEDAADAHRQRNHAGPTLVTERFAAAGLMPQEPPDRMDNKDPARWSAVFTKP